MIDTLRLYPMAAFLVLLASTLLACAREGSVQSSAASTSTDSLTANASVMAPPYAFDRPDTLIRLPNSLREISGLTVLDDETLGAVQDEKGKLYLLDLRTGDIQDDPRFHKDGDFEDLARVDDRVFVLRSDGTLYEIANWREKDLESTKHKTKLSQKHDTEGLVYDAEGARLLIACKEYPGEGLQNQRAIYAFDLTRMALIDEPAFTIDLAAVAKRAGAESGPNALARRVLGQALDLNGFKPSALALHPVTGHLYVLSSVRKAIVVLNPDGTMEAVWMLPDKAFRQPESLAFLPNGDLFIASEGNGKRATLMRFAYRP